MKQKTHLVKKAWFKEKRQNLNGEIEKGSHWSFFHTLLKAKNRGLIVFMR